MPGPLTLQVSGPLGWVIQAVTAHWGSLSGKGAQEQGLEPAPHPGPFPHGFCVGVKEGKLGIPVESGSSWDSAARVLALEEQRQ